MQKKSVRIAAASIVAVLSVFGLSQASVAAPGANSARTGGGWCC
jgi:hypothetical protein